MNKSANWIIGYITLLSTVCGLAIWAAILNKYLDGAEYTFRAMALLPLISSMINVFLLFILARRVQFSETGSWFLLHILSLVLWSFAEFMQRISLNLDTSVVWRSIAVFGWSTMPMFYFLFAFSYVEKQLYMRKVFMHAGMLMFAAGLIFAQLKTELVISNDYRLTPWGYDSGNNWAINLFALWFFTLFIGAAIILIQDYKKTLSKDKRAQIRLFLISVSIPLVGGTLTDIVLPEVFGMQVWPMAATLTASAGILLGFAVYKYGLFNLNPASLSGEIMETLPQPVIGTDEKFIIQFVNDNAAKMFAQYAPFRNRSISELIGRENYSSVQKAISTKGNAEIVSIDKIPLGLEEGVVIAQAQIRKINLGDLKGYIFALSNITQQVLTMKIIEKEVRVRTELYNQEKARLLSSVNGLRQGFLITDTEGHILLMNSMAQKLFGSIKVSDTESGHVVDTKAMDYLQNKVQQFDFKSTVNQVISSNDFTEFRGVEIEQSIFDIEILPISDQDKVIGVVVLFDDVTERTLIERSKDEFFSIASHELRTPLTAIRGNTSMILDYYKDQLQDDTLKEMVQDIHESSLRLIEIVNDFLDTSRLEQDRMTFELSEFPIEKVIREVTKETSLVAKERDNRIEIEGDIKALPSVYADKNKTKEVMYNLIGNSIKFTEHGSIKVFADLEADHIKVTVTDTGRGIPEEMKKLLFRKFQQAGPSILTRDTTKGTGLGLYISRLMIEKMGGKIDLVSSEPGIGSTFCFTLPIAKEGASVVK